MSATLVILVGSLLVLLYSWHRFSEPSGKRASTTAIRYYLAGAFYCLWCLFIYATLVIVLSTSGSQDVVKAKLEIMFASDLKPFTSMLPLPILVALALTMLLPKVSVIAYADGWVREQIEYMASIPYEVRRLAAELERSDTAASGVTFTLTSAMQERVRQRLQAQEFVPTQIRFSGNDLATQWTKATSLVLALADWRADANLASACATCAVAVEEVLQAHEELMPRVRRCLRALGAVQGDTGDSEARRILSEYTGEVERQAKALLGKIYLTVAAATLRCELTHKDRMARLTKLGFQLGDSLNIAPLTVAHRLAGLYVGLAVGFLSLRLALKYFGYGWWPGYVFTFALSTIVPLTYVIAVLWAIFLKRSWGGVTRPRGEARPFLAYLLSGLLAAASNLPIGLGLSFLHPESKGSVAEALAQSLVWLLLSLVTATATAFLIDDQPRSIARRWGGRWSEGAVQGAVTAAIALFVGQILIETKLNPRLDLFQLVPMAAAIGFTIGALVPTWYRTRTRRSVRHQKVRRLEVAAPSSPTEKAA